MTGGGLREEADTGVVLEPSKPVPDCAHTSPSPGVASPVPDCALTSPSPGVPPPVPDCAITSPSPGVAPPVPDCALTSPSPGVPPPVPDCALTSPSPGVPPPGRLGAADLSDSAPHVDETRPCVRGSMQTPRPCVRGSMQTPRPYVKGSMQTPRPCVRGSMQTPRHCVRGSMQTPRPYVKGSMQTPRPYVNGSMQIPCAVSKAPASSRLFHRTSYARRMKKNAKHNWEVARNAASLFKQILQSLADQRSRLVYRGGSSSPSEPGERVDVGPCAAGDNVCGERDSQDGCRADKSPVASDNPLHHEKETQEALYTWKRAQELADNLWQDYQWAVERCAFEVEDAKRGPGVENHRPGCFSARTSWIPETWKAAKEHVSVLRQNYEGFERGLGRSKPDKDDGSSSSFGLSEMSQDEKPEKENGHCDVEHSKPVCDDPSSSPVTIRKTELSDKERVWSGCGGDSDAHQGVSARTLWTPQLWKEAKNNVDIFQRNYQGFESAAREPQTPLCASQRGQQNRGANFERIISLISHSSINAENLSWKREDGCTLGVSEEQSVAGYLRQKGARILCSYQPSVQPSTLPSVPPSVRPSTQPSVQPSVQPSTWPSVRPSTQPSVHVQPSTQPSTQPSVQLCVQTTRKKRKAPQQCVCCL